MHTANIEFRKYMAAITITVFTGAALLLGGCGSKAEPTVSNNVETTEKEVATPKSVEQSLSC